MTRRNLQQHAEVEITTFSKKGHGVGFTCDEHKREVEVPFTIPGDRAKALIQRKKSGVFSSRLEEIAVPSPDRIAPRCVHFGVCGGCRWQQMDYSKQLRIKQNYIEELFSPLLGSEQSVLPILPAEPHWKYRNKMEFSFSSDAAGHKYLGLIMDSSRGKVLNISECHLVNEWFCQALHAARAWWHESGATAYHPHANKGSLRTLTVREGMRTGDRSLMLTVSGNPEDALTKKQLDMFVAYMRDAIEPNTTESKLSIMLRIQQAIKGQETNFFEMVLYGPDTIREILHVKADADKPAVKLEFLISPSAFFQPNTMQAERLYSVGLQMVKIPEDSVVYDLYCGTGTLGICAAAAARLVVGIELSPESSLDARGNAAKNGFNNVHILTGAAHNVIADIRKEQSFPMPDVVMVDPPRAGLDAGTLQHIHELNPTKLLYISCNPATQAENIKTLLTMGYRVDAVQPVDQFPHTVHVENIAVLTKAS